MKELHKVCRIIFFIAIYNFLAFVVISLIIGGDAVNGHETVGHYYLANHGKFNGSELFRFFV